VGVLAWHAYGIEGGGGSGNLNSFAYILDSTYPKLCFNKWLSDFVQSDLVKSGPSAVVKSHDIVLRLSGNPSLGVVCLIE